MPLAQGQLGSATSVPPDRLWTSGPRVAGCALGREPGVSFEKALCPEQEVLLHEKQAKEERTEGCTL